MLQVFPVRFWVALPGLERAGRAEVEKVGEELGLVVEQVSTPHPPTTLLQTTCGAFSVVLKQKKEDREDDIVTR